VLPERRYIVTCEISRSLLHGYLDGELDSVRAGEFERHLEGCSHCIAELGEQESLRASLQAAKLYEPAPSGLSKKVKRQIARKEPDMEWSWVPIWRWIAVSIAIVVVVAVAYVGGQRIWSARTSVTQQAALTEVIDAHMRSLQPGHLTDVASTDQHTVKPWFDGKLDYVPPVRDFKESGFPLVGGRLDVLQGRTVAVLIYGRRKHFINVFVWPESEKNPEIPAVGTRSGYQWVYSQAQRMEFCAVSDVSAADLQNLLELLKE
jgi:anti-sigma factor RsiW